MKIALISPNTNNLSAMALSLSGLSHHVISIEGGKSKLRAVVEQHAAELVIVEGMCCDPNELAQVEYVTTYHPATAVVLLCATHTPEFLMQSMRVGVREVLPSPVPADMLVAMVARVEAKLKGAQPRGVGKILAFMPCKGGSGATFLAANLGYHLAASHSVLLIDLNLQFGDALAVLHDGRPASTLADVAHGIARLDASLLASSAVSITPSYSVLAAPEDPSQAVEIKPEHIDAILGTAVEQYDFVLLDMSRNIDTLAIRALDRSWRIFPVTQLSVPAVRGARHMLAAFRALGYPPEKAEVIINRYEKSASISLDDVRKSLGNVTLRTVPNSYREVNASIDQGTALVMASRSNTVARTIAELGDSLKAKPPGNRGFLDRLLRRA